MESTERTIPQQEILVVEDSLTQALKLQFLLEQNGYSVAVARNGKAALQLLDERAKNGQVAIVITDIVMPEMNGYDMCRAIKNDPTLNSMQVILLTTLSDPEDIILGLEAGADYYLTKPYNEGYLLANVRTLLNAPPPPSEPQSRLDVTINERTYTITADRRQMLNLLLSIYGSAAQRNRELQDAQQQLNALNEELSAQQGKLQEANAKLQALATEDGLTGLKNRRALNEKLEEEVDRAMRYQSELSLVLLDVDHFKKYNDTFGHLAGDGVLQIAAQLLKSHCRPSDFVARYGGEEFALVLPNTDEEGALNSAERLRYLMETASWKERAVTASFGVTSFRGSEQMGGQGKSKITELIAQADAALYRSKAQGRNRVTHWLNVMEETSHQ